MKVLLFPFADEPKATDRTNSKWQSQNLNQGLYDSKYITF